MMDEALVLPAGTKESKQIRNILRVYFPKIVFDCNVDYKGDYQCIYVSYTDGVSLIRVKNAVKCLNRPSDLQIQRLGVKVIVERTMSERIKDQIISEIKSVFRMEQLPKEDDWFEPIKGTIRNYMDKIFAMRDFN